MKNIFFFLVLLFSFNTFAINTVKVAVIDTGFDSAYNKKVKLCPNGHKDFTGEGLYDTNGHGTNVVGLITTHATGNYCIVLIKAFSSIIPGTHTTEALTYAYQIGADIINLSGGGKGVIESEKQIVLKLLKKNVILAFAAGNDKKNLDKDCSYYPACYDKEIYVIGGYTDTSNYGNYVDAKFDDQNQTAFGRTLSGTSQATAIFTGKLLNMIDLLSKQ